MFNRIIKAALKLKNILLLGFIAIISIITGYYLPFMLIGLAGYVYFIMQTMKDADFQNDYVHDQAIDEIRKLSSSCDASFNKLKKEVDRKLFLVLKTVISEKDQLMQLFMKEKEDLIKQKVMFQGLNLILTYFKTVSEYKEKLDSSSSTNMTKIRERIKVNTKSLNILDDKEAIQDLKKALDIDMKLLQRLEEEKLDVEKLAAKMIYMESLLKTLKHQLNSDENSEELMKDIQKVTDEVYVLDSVLEEKRNERQRL